jgi:hypothetical protein
MACTNRVTTYGARSMGHPDCLIGRKPYPGLQGFAGASVVRKYVALAQAEARDTPGRGYMITNAMAAEYEEATFQPTQVTIPSQKIKARGMGIVLFQCCSYRGKSIRIPVQARYLEKYRDVRRCPLERWCALQARWVHPYALCSARHPRIDIAANTRPLIYRRRARCGGHRRQTVDETIRRLTCIARDSHLLSRLNGYRRGGVSSTLHCTNGRL